MRKGIAGGLLGGCKISQGVAVRVVVCVGLVRAVDTNHVVKALLSQTIFRFQNDTFPESAYRVST